MALDLPNDKKAYERVVVAFEQGAFNRTIILDGDSLTHQLFISLGCLSWLAGYVEDFTIPHQHVHSKDTNEILMNTHCTASSVVFTDAHAQFKGGAVLYQQYQQ